MVATVVSAAKKGPGDGEVKRSKRASSEAMAEFGARLAEARRNVGFTQDNLADFLGLSQRAIQLYETGEAKNPPYKHIREISRLLEVSSEWLLSGEDGEEDELKRELENISKLLRSMMRKIDRLERQ